MENSIIKKEIHDFIERADNRFLDLIYSLVLAEQKKAGITDAIIKDEIIKRAKQSEKEIDEGKTISVQQFNLNLQKWKREKLKNIK